MPLPRPRRRSKKRPRVPPATQEESQLPLTYPRDLGTQEVELQPHNSRAWRWSDEQTLYFLQRLLEARRNGELNVNKAVPYRHVLEGFILGFKATWDTPVWCFETLKNKLRNLKDFWRAFRDAADLSGTEYDEETSRLYISRANMKKIKERYPQHGKKVVTEGLLVGPFITYDSWQEIFTDDPPAGRLIAAASDESVWAGHEAEGQDSDALIADDDDDEVEAVIEVADEGRDEGEDEDNDELVELPQSQLPNPFQLPDSQPKERGDSQRVSETPLTPMRGLTPSSSQLRRRRRNAISEYYTPALSSSRKKQKNEGPLTKEELMKLFRDDSHRSLSLSARPTGSEDLEKAVSNCLEVIREAKGLPYAVKAVSLFKEVRNAVIWNALGSKEVKEAWVESQIGPAE